MCRERSFYRSERLQIRMRRSLVQLAVVIALLSSPAAAVALPKAPAATRSSPTAQRVLQGSLQRSLGAAGGASGAYVVDLTTGRPLFSAAAGAARLPASVEKVYTTSTALTRFGAEATLSTTILGVGNASPGGAWRGTLYLKGGGDPTFGSASYDRYAYGAGATMQRLVTNLRQATGMTSFQGRIVGDESLFDSLRGTSATGFAVSAYLEGVLSGLAYDRGFADEQGDSFQTRPALFAATRLSAALRAAGVRVSSGTRVVSGNTPPSAAILASVHSPRMATLIQLTNSPSDNFFAEMLLKELGARFGGAGSTAAGASIVRAQVARSFGIHPQVVDGSGLSRSDRTSPREVVTALSALNDNPAFVSSLSVAGQSGTMQAGLRGTAAQGRCRGKTGTLHDVANLVGYCTGRDGHQLAFAFLMNSVDPTTGHAIEDRMAVALAQYGG